MDYPGEDFDAHQPALWDDGSFLPEQDAAVGRTPKPSEKQAKKLSFKPIRVDTLPAGHAMIDGEDLADSDCAQVGDSW